VAARSSSSAAARRALQFPRLQQILIWTAYCQNDDFVGRDAKQDSIEASSPSLEQNLPITSSKASFSGASECDSGADASERSVLKSCSYHDAAPDSDRDTSQS
jgi:hypothetical protein